MKTQVMIDLETFGTKPGSVIVSIGAVKFDRSEIYSEFYQVIDPADCQRYGLTLDADTVKWWLTKDEAARSAIASKGEPLEQVLCALTQWMGNDCEVWGNGASFDNALLAAAYKQTGIPLPWKYWNDRCYRTMKDVFPGVKMERTGTHHNALDDARSQARHLIQIFRQLSPLLCR